MVYVPVLVSKRPTLSSRMPTWTCNGGPLTTGAPGMAGTVAAAGTAAAPGLVDGAAAGELPDGGGAGAGAWARAGLTQAAMQAINARPRSTEQIVMRDIVLWTIAP